MKSAGSGHRGGLLAVRVFVPPHFRQRHHRTVLRQFALTIAVSTVISAFNSLTLSPALSAVLLKPHHAKKDWFARATDVALGWFFRLFNKSFEPRRTVTLAPSAARCGAAASRSRSMPGCSH
jgi:multidrug efflux pump subunit AcrB